MKISANELRVGIVIEYKGKLWTVCKLQHVKPGKGGAFMQTELKAIKGGTKLNERFRSDENLERVRLDEEEYQKTLQKVEEKINSGQYQGKDSIEDVYGELGVYIRGRFKDKNELATLAALQAEGSMKKDKDGLDNALEKLYNQKLEAAIQKYKTENDGAEPTGSEYDSIVQSIGQELAKTYEQEDIIAAQQQIVKPVVK